SNKMRVLLPPHFPQPNLTSRTPHNRILPLLLPSPPHTLPHAPHPPSRAPRAPRAPAPHEPAA
ncbi:hypothetical protein H0H92_013274, partial [Tricholoma furcatifolium]